MTRGSASCCIHEDALAKAAALVTCVGTFLAGRNSGCSTFGRASSTIRGEALQLSAAGDTGHSGELRGLEAQRHHHLTDIPPHWLNWAAAGMFKPHVCCSRRKLCLVAISSVEPIHSMRKSRCPNPSRVPALHFALCYTHPLFVTLKLD